VRYLLQLGKRFGLSFLKKNKERPIIEFIKCIEKNIFRLVEKISSDIRNQTIPIIKRFSQKANSLDLNEKFLRRVLQCTRKFVRDNLDILLMKADKGNIMVAIDVSNYSKKMNELLSDSNTYVVIKKDPTKKLMMFGIYWPCG